ncbi:MAG: hypothetical protein A2Z25_11865 [Planctomycetes bacterium RBG_16_55_9]|nr:MAG: hypothetical protein A2Z25_11865 [Planctomycetes bacterium RBG_16_55_9]
MGGFSNYWEDKILDYVFSKGSYTPPTIHVALSTEDPLDDASGFSEPTGNSYARVETSSSDWNTASGGILNNAGDVIFPKTTGSWGTVTHFALFDAATGGNMLAYGALSQPITIESSYTALFDAGDLNISLD